MTKAHYKTFANESQMLKWWMDYKDDIHGCHEVGEVGEYTVKFYLNH